MSYDLILKRSNINWARGGTVPAPQPTAPVMQTSQFLVSPASRPFTPPSQWGYPDARQEKILKIAIATGQITKDEYKFATRNLAPEGVDRVNGLIKKLAIKPMKVRTHPIPATIELSPAEQKVWNSLLVPPSSTTVRGEFIGAYPTQILGSSLNDDELAQTSQFLVSPASRPFTPPSQWGYPDARQEKILKIAIATGQITKDEYKFATRNLAPEGVDRVNGLIKKLAIKPMKVRTHPIPATIELSPAEQKVWNSLLVPPSSTTVRGEFIGAYPTEILGSDLNDDELAVAQEGGASERQALARVRGEFIGRSEIGRRRRRAGKRTHHLKKIVKKAAQGDANALAQMQRVQQRLSQRAASGDPRANTLLQRINQWYTQYQSQYQSTTQTQYPAYPQPYQTPYGTPYSPSQQPYSPYPGVPGAPGDDEQELATTDPEL